MNLHNADGQVRSQSGHTKSRPNRCNQRDQVGVKSCAQVADGSLALINWHENLPSSLALNYASPKNALPHILMMHLSHAWLVILLHRPFYRPLHGMPGIPGEPNAAANRAASAVKVSQSPMRR